MAEIIFIGSKNEDRTVSSSSWVKKTETTLNGLILGLLSTNNFSNIGNTIKDVFSYYLKKINNNQTCVNDGDGQSYDFNSCLVFGSLTSSDINYYNSYLAGKRLKIIIYGTIPINQVMTKVPVFYFDDVLPVNSDNSSSIHLVSSHCLWELLDNLNLPLLNFNYASMGGAFYYFGCESQGYVDGSDNGCFCLYDTPPSPDECDDSRSSSSTSEFLITLNGENVLHEQDSVSYRLLIQPDSNHTSGEITLSNTDNIYSSFRKYNGASVRMLDNVCCHGSGTIDIIGDVHIEGFGINEVADVMLPVWRSLIRENVVFLHASFEDECCCFATGYSDEISDLVNQYMQGYSSYDATSEFVSSFIPKKIRWSGFERLTDFCCDESDCAEINEYEYEIDIPDNSGGGDNVDISCICNGLTSMTQMLSSKLDNIVDGQAVIAEAIENIEVSIDNQCVCDNLETINDTLETINDTISNKEMCNNVTVEPSTVDNINQITVTPCQPIVTNPVNNITVEPSTVDNINQITVTPCQPIVTNPVNNITVEPSTVDIDLSNIETILEDSLNHDNKSISAIIDNSLNMINPCDENESLSITQALFKVTDDGENCTIKSISEILDEKFLEPQIDIVLDNQLVGHIYKQNYDYRNY